MEAMKTDISPVGLSEQEKYPVSLRIYFTNDQIEQIPMLDALNVGDRLKLAGEAFVLSIKKEPRQDEGSQREVCIQIDQLAAEPIKKPEELTMPEYRDMRNKKQTTRAA